MRRYHGDMGLVEREAEMQELNAPRPDRSRDLFGVQLEVRLAHAHLRFAHSALSRSRETLRVRDNREREERA